jgi:hypothetical protein
LKNFIQPGNEKGVDFSTCMYVNNELATCNISSITKMCDNCEGSGSSEGEKEGDNVSPAHSTDQLEQRTGSFI